MCLCSIPTYITEHVGRFRPKKVEVIQETEHQETASKNSSDVQDKKRVSRNLLHCTLLTQSKVCPASRRIIVIDDSIGDRHCSTLGTNFCGS